MIETSLPQSCFCLKKSNKIERDLKACIKETLYYPNRYLSRSIWHHLTISLNIFLYIKMWFHIWKGEVQVWRVQLYKYHEMKRMVGFFRIMFLFLESTLKKVFLWKGGKFWKENTFFLKHSIDDQTRENFYNFFFFYITRAKHDLIKECIWES